MMLKQEILLSPEHPSVLEKNFFTAEFLAPLIVSSDLVLIDGYRRYQAIQDPAVEVIRMNANSLYHAALDLNRNTRDWDEIDIFFWKRWAKSLGVSDTGLPDGSLPESLQNAPTDLLIALANRDLQIGQAIRILQLPPGTCSFFVETLSSTLLLNVNETAQFIDLTFDLANREGVKDLKTVFNLDPLQRVITDPDLDRRRKGQSLLKEMRQLRYPLYQRKTEDFSAAWRELNLQGLQVNKGLFLDRGILEVTISARTRNEMLQQVRNLSKSLASPAWDQIWEQEGQGD